VLEKKGDSDLSDVLKVESEVKKRAENKDKDLRNKIFNK